VRSFLIPAELAVLEDHCRTGALIQRFDESVTAPSERSLVIIGGEYSHAVRRIAFNTGNTPDTPEFDHRALEGEIAFATQVPEPALFLTRLPRLAHRLASTVLRSFSG
jgi:hypothetical protein